LPQRIAPGRRVAHGDELGERPLEVELLREPWVLVRMGVLVRALVDRGSHGLAPLSAGTVVGADRWAPADERRPSRSAAEEFTAPTQRRNPRRER
jgi:hypothetical protein